MEDIKQKQVAGLLAALAERATTQYVDGSDMALQIQIDQVESALTDLENEVVVHETRLDLLEARPVSDAAADRNRANHTGTQAISTVDGLRAELDAKAASSHTHISTSILDFQEAVQDAVAAFMRAGGGVSLSYDDANNTYTITSSPGETFDPERTRDAIGAALVPLGLIDIAINDAADTISISTRATQNAPDAQLRDRDTHTGTQAIDTVQGLTAALTSKASTAAVSAHTTRLNALEAVLLASELNADKQAEWSGLTPRAALLRLINQGSTTTPPTPTAPAAPTNGLVDDTADTFSFTPATY